MGDVEGSEATDLDRRCGALDRLSSGLASWCTLDVDLRFRFYPFSPDGRAPIALSVQRLRKP
jgi:hypothetical protein